MRSGLQSPGAIPLLAVLVAALLSITPNLCEAWTKPEIGHGIGQPVDSSIYEVNFVSTIPQHMSFNTGPGWSIFTTLDSIDLLWQHFCHITASALHSSVFPSQRIAETIYEIERDHDDSNRVLDSSPQQSLGPVHDSSDPHLITNSTSITIALVSPSADGNKLSLSSSLISPSSELPSTTQHPSTLKSQESALVNSSNPVDRKGSYMAVLVSLVVAIMWF